MLAIAACRARHILKINQNANCVPIWYNMCKHVQGYQKNYKTMPYTRRRNHAPRNMKVAMPTNPPTNIIVKIPAPALSPVVTGFVVWPLPASSFSPALRLLLLFPPVVDVTGGPYSVPLIHGSICTLKALLALICCSIPCSPSQVPVVHRTPHVLLLLPVQEFAAPWPVACSFERISSYSDGMRRAVWASQLATRPLKRTSLLLQISRVSHSQSEMI